VTRRAVATHIVNTDPISESIMTPVMLAITGTLGMETATCSLERTRGPEPYEPKAVEVG
jgi:hypothetical protein